MIAFITIKPMNGSLDRSCLFGPYVTVVGACHQREGEDDSKPGGVDIPICFELAM